METTFSKGMMVAFINRGIPQRKNAGIITSITKNRVEVLVEIGARDFLGSWRVLVEDLEPATKEEQIKMAIKKLRRR